MYKAEFQALQELANNRHIVIKKSDKGSAVVVQSTEQYLKECLRQLSDRKFYTPESRDFTLEHNNKVHNLVDDIHSNGSISDKCADYLKIINPRVPAFYTLPKIHKKMNPPPGRPILSANDALTERISEFVDHFLQPYLVEMKSYVKDTTGFVKDIKSLRKIPKNAFLVSLDIVSLYILTFHIMKL